MTRRRFRNPKSLLSRMQPQKSQKARKLKTRRYLAKCLKQTYEVNALDASDRIEVLQPNIGYVLSLGIGYLLSS